MTTLQQLEAAVILQKRAVFPPVNESVNMTYEMNVVYLVFFFHFAPKYVLGGETKQWSFLPTVCFSLAREGTGQ